MYIIFPILKTRFVRVGIKRVAFHFSTFKNHKNRLFFGVSYWILLAYEKNSCFFNSPHSKLKTWLRFGFHLSLPSVFEQKFY